MKMQVKPTRKRINLDGTRKNRKCLLSKYYISVNNIRAGKQMKKGSKKKGLVPGTPVHIGQKKTDKSSIRLTDFSENQIIVKEEATEEDIAQQPPVPMIRWNHLTGVHDVELVQNLCKQYAIHPLVVEDIVNTEHRPKIEFHSDYIFLVLKTFNLEGNDSISIEQISFILGSSYLLSFQESEDPIFQSIINRLEKKHGNVRSLGADYLAYSLLDLIVDDYYVFTESLSEYIETLEDEVIENPTTATLHGIYRFKRIVSIARRNLWPLREIVGRLYRDPSSLIQSSTNIYMRDLYDHVIQVNDYLEGYKEALSSMLDTYLSSVSNKMNEVMKVLTVISTVFIPLTLIAGVYGMNFYNMPELTWQYGYSTLLIIMIIIGAVMLAYFRKIEWI
ncbi:MAG: magnesium/cobalt transporter CorA [Candidatus Thorarchaeota archaeon]|nr:MAG: magnesium/cobalt transporter CorA [Candidatus Thorarchaeota archaeon]